MTALRARLADPACRLLTLVGPGGIGKTRLALEAAAQAASGYADGVTFVPLVSLTDAEFVIPAIAQALRFTFAGPRPLQDQLLDYLRDKALLLVLDNFEHLLGEESIELLLDLLRAAPQVTLLVTSRERLNVQAEFVFPVEGLPPGDAVRLFVERAHRVRPSFALGVATVPDVTRICRLVDGMPLAIKLAAAWMRHRSLDQVIADLTRGLDGLTVTLRDIPERHRSLRTVCDGSWRLLSPTEQAIMRALAVFRGGFEQVAAWVVAGADERTLLALVDKSLLRLTDSGRYEVDEVLRQYAEAKLTDAAETEATRDRHVACYLRLAEEAEPRLRGPDALAWLDRLEVEHDNLRSALGWALARGAVEDALRLSGALAYFWETRGYLSEGRCWLETILDLASSAVDFAAARAKVLAGAGRLAFRQGDSGLAARDGQASLALYRELGDRWGQAVSLQLLGHSALGRGDNAQARVFYTESLAFFREVNDQEGIAAALDNLGVTYAFERDYDRATALYEEGLAMQRRLGNARNLAVAQMLLAYVALFREDLERASALFAEVLTWEQQVEDRYFIVYALVGAGGVAGARGQGMRAARLFGAAEALRQALGASLVIPYQRIYDRLVAVARQHLNPAAFDAAWTAGRELTAAQAIAYALAPEAEAGNEWQTD